MLSAGNLNPMFQASTWFFTNSSAVAAENIVAIPMSQSCTFSNMYASTLSTPAAGQTFTLTMRKNAVDQALTCQITNPNFTANDNTHSFSVVAGDLVSVKLVTSATSGTANGMAIGLKFTALST
jgi:hypothetical protein